MQIQKPTRRKHNKSKGMQRNAKKSAELEKKNAFFKKAEAFFTSLSLTSYCNYLKLRKKKLIIES